MARVLVVEPVEETRVLIECVVRRMGHDVVSSSALRDVDVVFYDPNSRAGHALALRVRSERPEVRLVACSASPPERPERELRPFASLMQPFSPGDLKRVLEAALLGARPAAPLF